MLIGRGHRGMRDVDWERYMGTLAVRIEVRCMGMRSRYVGTRWLEGIAEVRGYVGREGSLRYVGMLAGRGH